MLDQTAKTKWPEAFEPFWKPYRYKGVYGGRGGAKSHTLAEMLLVRCSNKTTRAVCVREVQNTIKDSVRQLLIDKIEKLQLGWFFQVLDNEIRGLNGSLIVFKGMQSYNAENIKSLEDFDIAWVEEAQTLSEKSLRLLRPTIRKEGSELWFSWNPRHDTDAVDRFFRGGDKRSSMITIQVNYDDNPWFPAVLKQEKNEDFEIDPEMAEHVWHGGYEILSEAAYYARQLFAADQEGRIGDFPYNPALSLITAWDIGVDDYTDIWFIQEDGINAFVVDFFETSGAGAEEIVRSAMPELIPDDIEMALGLKELGRDVPFVYSNHYLPHDVRVREWGAGARTRYITLKGLGVKPIHVGAPANPQDRINAVRRILGNCYFNNTSRVQAGIAHLRRYSRRIHTDGYYLGPKHDEHSHAADGFGEFAINCRIAPKVEPEKPKPKELEYMVMPDGTIQGNMTVKEAVEAMVRRRRGRG